MEGLIHRKTENFTTKYQGLGTKKSRECPKTYIEGLVYGATRTGAPVYALKIKGVSQIIWIPHFRAVTNHTAQQKTTSR